ncbi:MAG: peptidoglycan-binding protein [Clostridia bacterium]|nr:peptidoglycan-binding protein [Clostridia bacterium]
MNSNIFEREATTNLQRYLRQLSYHDEAINPVPIDGIWDAETERALVAFQKQNGLSPTGRVDRTTWELLKRRYEESIAQNSPPAKLEIFPRLPLDYALNEGDTGFIVDAVQYVLGELEQLYTFGPYTPSGTYDEPTARLVTLFQDKNGIAPTGRVNRETWDALAVQHNLLANRYQ